jgi:hypothetical protein
VLAREEVDLARRELTAKARQAAAGAGMVGGGALLGVLAAGTGTAALVLMLSGRGRPSVAALGVTGIYAAGGAAFAQQGMARLRAAAPLVDDKHWPAASSRRYGLARQAASGMAVTELVD